MGRRRPEPHGAQGHIRPARLHRPRRRLRAAPLPPGRGLLLQRRTHGQGRAAGALLPELRRRPHGLPGPLQRPLHQGRHHPAALTRPLQRLGVQRRVLQDHLLPEPARVPRAPDLQPQRQRRLPHPAHGLLRVHALQPVPGGVRGRHRVQPHPRHRLPHVQRHVLLPRRGPVRRGAAGVQGRQDPLRRDARVPGPPRVAIGRHHADPRQRLAVRHVLPHLHRVRAEPLGHPVRGPIQLRRVLPGGRRHRVREPHVQLPVQALERHGRVLRLRWQVRRVPLRPHAVHRHPVPQHGRVRPGHQRPVRLVPRPARDQRPPMEQARHLHRQPTVPVRRGLQGRLHQERLHLHQLPGAPRQRLHLLRVQLDLHARLHPHRRRLRVLPRAPALRRRHLPGLRQAHRPVQVLRPVRDPHHPRHLHHRGRQRAQHLQLRLRPGLLLHNRRRLRQPLGVHPVRPARVRLRQRLPHAVHRHRRRRLRPVRLVRAGVRRRPPLHPDQQHRVRGVCPAATKQRRLDHRLRLGVRGRVHAQRHHRVLRVQAALRAQRAPRHHQRLRRVRGVRPPGPGQGVPRRRPVRHLRPHLPRPRVPTQRQGHRQHRRRPLPVGLQRGVHPRECNRQQRHFIPPRQRRVLRLQARRRRPAARQLHLLRAGGGPGLRCQAKRPLGPPRGGAPVPLCGL